MMDDKNCFSTVPMSLTLIFSTLLHISLDKILCQRKYHLSPFLHIQLDQTYLPVMLRKCTTERKCTAERLSIGLLVVKELASECN